MTYPVAGDAPEDFSDLIGLTPQEAQARSGLAIRVTMRDGRPLIVTHDYRLDRLNVSVADGLVDFVRGRG